MEHRITQRWWNGYYGMASERLRIHCHVVDGEEHWAVERVSAENENTQLAYPCDSEQHACETVEQLHVELGGTWVRVDDKALGYRS